MRLQPEIGLEHVYHLVSTTIDVSDVHLCHAAAYPTEVSE
jgi:hypothetical protein